MSALIPHIRVLRAEAVALRDQADKLNVGKQTDWSQMLVGILLATSTAKFTAAAQLEAAEPRLREDEHPITYDPKGKR